MGAGGTPIFLCGSEQPTWCIVLSSLGVSYATWILFFFLTPLLFRRLYVREKLRLRASSSRSSAAWGAAVTESGTPTSPIVTKWDSPRICRECSCECCVAWLYPCLAFRALETAVDPSRRSWFSLVCAPSHSVSFFFGVLAWQATWAIYYCWPCALCGPCVLAGMNVGFQQRLGRQMGVSQNSECRDLRMFLCCWCYQIVSMNRTVEKWVGETIPFRRILELGQSLWQVIFLIGDRPRSRTSGSDCHNSIEFDIFCADTSSTLLFAGRRAPSGRSPRRGGTRRDGHADPVAVQV